MTKFIVNGKQGYKTYHDWKAFWGMKGAPSTPPGPPVDYTIPLYIEAPADTPNPSGWDISLPSSYVRGNTRHIEYSFDRVTWTSVTLQNDQNGSFTNPVCHIDKGQKVYLRGSNVSWSSAYYSNFKLKITSEGHFSGIKVGGNIMSILYGENFTGEERSFPAGSTSTFAGFFSESGPNALTISDVSELLLPATTLTDYCYYGIFSLRNSITTAPILPATILAQHCYDNMFQGCTSLTAAPTLPVTTLARSCYDSMFSGCSSLTQAPVLPAVILVYGCYNNMFSNCSSLTQAPELPATTLANSCYRNMFTNCSSLTQAPVLPATTLTNNCYDNMFSGCSSLTQAPTLPATTLADRCYYSMFSYCGSLTQAPVLPATTLASGCYDSMFNGCFSLTQAPELPATTLVDNCYANMFSNCSSLTQAPVLPATILTYYCYINMFSGCSSLEYIKCLAVDDASYLGDFRTYCEGWVDGVSSNGTFIASDNYSSGWYWGKDGVPENWTTQTESGSYFEPTQGGGAGSQIYRSNGLTVYEMGSGQGGYPVQADWRNMMVPDFNGNDYCFAMMKISNDDAGTGDAYMTPHLGGGVAAYISYEVMDDGTCPFSYNSDGEYDNYEYSLMDGDDGNQITPNISSGNCRWVKFVKNQGTYEGNTPYIEMNF